MQEFDIVPNNNRRFVLLGAPAGTELSWRITASETSDTVLHDLQGDLEPGSAGEQAFVLPGAGIAQLDVSQRYVLVIRSGTTIRGVAGVTVRAFLPL